MEPEIESKTPPVRHPRRPYRSPMPQRAAGSALRDASAISDIAVLLTRVRR
jgi:hypothetical protein